MFALSGPRELLTEQRAIELAAPLREAIAAGEFEKFSHIQLSGKSFGREAARVFADLIVQLKGVKIADFNDIIAGRSTDVSSIRLNLF